jgi:hypothetical protein
MKVHERVAGIDVHKDMVKVAIRSPGDKPWTRKTQILEFRTFYGVLQHMAADLRKRGVTHVVMEATCGFRSPAISASIMSRTETVVSLLATADTLIWASPAGRSAGCARGSGRSAAGCSPAGRGSRPAARTRAAASRARSAWPATPRRACLRPARGLLDVVGPDQLHIQPGRVQQVVPDPPVVRRFQGSPSRSARRSGGRPVPGPRWWSRLPTVWLQASCAGPVAPSSSTRLQLPLDEPQVQVRVSYLGIARFVPFSAPPCRPCLLGWDNGVQCQPATTRIRELPVSVITRLPAVHRHPGSVGELGLGRWAAVPGEPREPRGAGHGVDVPGGHRPPVEPAGAGRRHPDPVASAITRLRAPFTATPNGRESLALVAGPPSPSPPVPPPATV